MKIYLIEFNEYDYDQYDAFVVIADNKEKAIEKLRATHPSRGFGNIDWNSGYKIKEIKPENYKQTEIILGSFNAG